MWSGLAFAVGPIAQIVLIPQIIKSVGIDAFGMWSLFIAIVASSGIILNGLCDSVVRGVTIERSRKKLGNVHQTISDALQTGLIFGVLIASLFLIVLAIYLHLSTSNSLADGESHIFTVLSTSIILLIRGIQSALEGIIKGFERYDLEAKSTVQISILTHLLIYTLARLGHFSLFAGSVVYCASSIFTILLYLVIVRRFNLNKTPAKTQTTQRFFRDFISYSSFATIQNVAGVIMLQSDRFILSSSLGTGAVGVYSACLQVGQTAFGLIAKVLGFSFPKLITLFASEKRSESNRFYWRTVTISIILSSIVLSPMYYFSQDIIYLWLGSSVPANSYQILEAFCFVYAVTISSIATSQLLSSTGFIRVNSIVSVISTILVVISGIILIPRLGPIGGAYARIATLPLMIIVRIWIANTILSQSSIWGILSILIPCFAFIPRALWALLNVETASLHSKLAQSVIGLLLVAITSLTFHHFVNRDKRIALSC